MRKDIIKPHISDNRGMTMVEILVAFVILIFMLTAFYGIVKFSSNMLTEAVDNKERTQSYKECFYKENKEGLNKTDITPAGATFSLNVNMTKTDASNNASAASVALDHMAVVKYTGDGSVDPLNERLRVDVYEYR